MSLMIICEFNDFVVSSSMVIDGTRPLKKKHISHAQKKNSHALKNFISPKNLHKNIYYFI